MESLVKTSKSNSSKTINSINKAFSLLRCFLNDREELGVTELSNELGLYKSRVHRILKSLEQTGFIIKNPLTNKYRLGLKILELANAVSPHMNLKAIARPFVERLHRATNGTVALRVIDNNEILTLDKIESSEPLRVSIQIGNRVPLNYGAFGKLLMAFLTENEVDAFIKKNGLKRFNKNSITDIEKFKRHLILIRKQGYAFNNEEVNIGIRSIAAPIRNSNSDVIAALSLILPTVKFPLKKLSLYARLTKEAADKISLMIGYREKKIIA